MNCGRRKERWLQTKRRGGVDRKWCAFKESVSYVQGLSTISEKKPKKRPRDFLSDPFPILVWRGFTRTPHHLNGSRGLCTVPMHTRDAYFPSCATLIAHTPEICAYKGGCGSKKFLWFLVKLEMNKKLSDTKNHAFYGTNRFLKIATPILHQY